MPEAPAYAGSREGLIYTTLPLQAERLLRIEPVTFRPKWGSFTTTPGLPFKSVQLNNHKTRNCETISRGQPRPKDG